MSNKSLTAVSIEALKSNGPTFQHNFLFCLKRRWVPLWWVGSAHGDVPASNSAGFYRSICVVSLGGGEYTAVLYYCLNLLLAGLTLSQPVNSCKGERQNLQRLKESAVFGTAAAFGAVSHQYNNW